MGPLRIYLCFIILLIIRSSNAHCDPCICTTGINNSTLINCDYVNEILIPFKHDSIVNGKSFSQRYSGLKVLDKAYTDAQIQSLDYSHNLIRRLREDLFEGIHLSLRNLNLSHNLLGDQLNPIFSTNQLIKLINLRSLDLSHNLLRAIDSNIFNGLSNLTYLNLEANQFSHIPHQCLVHLPSLTTLRLGHNRFTTITTLPTLPSLVSLHLEDNNLNTIKSFPALNKLEYLNLASNSLTSFKSSTFAKLIGLKTLDLSDNYFDSIPNALSAFKSLRKLILKKNNIENLQFIDIPTLEYLDLSHNSINHISGPIGLGNLKYLSLANNNLGTADLDDLLISLISLEIINLSDNNLSFIPASFGLLKIKKLFADYNHLTRMDDIGGDELEEVSLAYNQITSLPLNLDRNLPNLRLLNLHGNRIDRITMDSFSSIADDLLGLDIGYNDLTEIPELSFPRLMILNLARNSFRSLDLDPFHLLHSLRFLNLSNNQIPFLPTGIFNNNPMIEIIDLSNNELDRIDRGVFCEPSLIRIYLSNNNIKEISMNAFENMPKLIELDLSFNQISSIKNLAFNLPSLKRLILAHNRMHTFKGDYFITSSKAFSSFQASSSSSSFSSTSTSSSSSSSFSSSSSLEYLDLCNNQINYVYQNSFIIHKKLRSLLLCNNRLSYFPNSLINTLKYLKFINLANNRLKSLNNSDFANMMSLKELDLSFNNISYISSNAFYKSSKLLEINLANNIIKSMDKDTFKGLIRVKINLSYNLLTWLPNNLFNNINLKILEEINLSNNNLTQFPDDVLNSQYLNLEEIILSHNNIENLPSNSDLLVNIKSLDLSYNPLSIHSYNLLFSQPKSVRSLSVAGIGINKLPDILETPFLKKLNLSNNELKILPDNCFDRVDLLELLDLSNNQLITLNLQKHLWIKLSSLRKLYLNGNYLTHIMRNDLHHLHYLQLLDMSNLTGLNYLECEFLNKFSHLQSLALHSYPLLNYFNTQECLTSLQSKLHQLSIEIKESILEGHLYSIISPRLSSLAIMGNTLKNISANFLKTIHSPLTLTISNTSISSLPPQLILSLPLSIPITIDISYNMITHFDYQLLDNLDNKQIANIQIYGIHKNPISCDCDVSPLWKWYQIKSSIGFHNPIKDINLIQCPKGLLISYEFNELTCDPLPLAPPSASLSSSSSSSSLSSSLLSSLSSLSSSSSSSSSPFSLSPSLISSSFSSSASSSAPASSASVSLNLLSNIVFDTTKSPTKTRAILKRPKYTLTSRLKPTLSKPSLTKVDSMIIGITAGVIAFVCILVLIICVMRLRAPSRYSDVEHCTCLKSAGCNTCYKSPACYPGYTNNTYTGNNKYTTSTYPSNNCYSGTLRIPTAAATYYSETLRPMAIKMMPNNGLKAKNSYYITYDETDHETQQK